MEGSVAKKTQLSHSIFLVPSRSLYDNKEVMQKRNQELSEVCAIFEIENKASTP